MGDDATPLKKFTRHLARLDPECDAVAEQARWDAKLRPDGYNAGGLLWMSEEEWKSTLDLNPYECTILRHALGTYSPIAGILHTSVYHDFSIYRRTGTVLFPTVATAASVMMPSTTAGNLDVAVGMQTTPNTSVHSMPSTTAGILDVAAALTSGATTGATRTTPAASESAKHLVHGKACGENPPVKIVHASTQVVDTSTIVDAALESHFTKADISDEANSDHVYESMCANWDKGSRDRYLDNCTKYQLSIYIIYMVVVKCYDEHVRPFISRRDKLEYPVFEKAEDRILAMAFLDFFNSEGGKKIAPGTKANYLQCLLSVAKADTHNKVQLAAANAITRWKQQPNKQKSHVGGPFHDEGSQDSPSDDEEYFSCNTRRKKAKTSQVHSKGW